jgi:hypothetical protein
MWPHVALVSNDVSEECIASINLTLPARWSHRDDGDDIFLQKVGFHKSHNPSHPRRRHSSANLAYGVARISIRSPEHSAFLSTQKK